MDFSQWALAPALQPPAAPSNLSATATSASQITLTWTDNSTNEAGFKIERSTDGSTWTQIATVGANTTSYQDAGLACNTTYYYRVRAYNAGGDSAYSNTAWATTDACTVEPPAAPSSLSATAASASQITLTWSDNSINEDGFKLERSTDSSTWTQIATVGANTTTYQDTGLACNTTYYYRVRAYNAGGSSDYSNTAWATTYECPVEPPAAPSSLSATAVSANQIELNWTDNSNNEDGFKIERSPDGGTWTQIATVSANVTTYQDTGLTCNTMYYYRVRAYNAGGNSAYSNIAWATTDACAVEPPAAPSNLSATATSASQITLTWSDNSDNETGFKVERSPDGGTWTQIATVSANVTTYQDTGLSCNTTYYYRVRAYNGSGDSGYSNTASATTYECPVEPPAAPSSLSATAASASQIELTWTDNSYNEDGFRIERWYDYMWVETAVVGANVTTYRDTGLSCNTTYYYRVHAYNGGGNSGYSNTAWATTDACTVEPPAAPTGLSATAVSASQINLAWNDNSDNEAGFKAERSTDGSTWTQIATVGANVTAYQDTGLACNTTYYYRVRAYNAGGDSAYSNVASATTRACAGAPPVVAYVLPTQGTNDVPVMLNIYGRSFAENVTVTLVGPATIPLEGLMRVNAGHIRGLVPAGAAAGLYDVVVTNPGAGSATLSGDYRVLEAQEPMDDLYATPQDLWVYTPTLRSGQNASLGLRVHRQGGKQPLTARVRFYVGAPGSGVVLGEAATPLIGANRSENTQPVTWRPEAAGEYAIYAVIDPDNQHAETPSAWAEANNVVSRTFTVLPAAPDTAPPRADWVLINDGAEQTAERGVSLDASGSEMELPGQSGVRSILYEEFEYSQGARDWVLVQSSGWLEYETSRTDYPWTLVKGPGMHYIRAWVADGAGNISPSPALDFINYVPPTEYVALGAVNVYRQYLQAGQRLVVRLTPSAGDADLYVWLPDWTAGAWANINAGTAEDVVAFTAPASGIYQIEVYGYTAASYTLEIAVNPTANVALVKYPTVPTGEKTRRGAPIVDPRDTPSERMAIPEPPSTPAPVYSVYLPLVPRNQ